MGRSPALRVRGSPEPVSGTVVAVATAAVGLVPMAGAVAVPRAGAATVALGG